MSLFRTSPVVLKSRAHQGWRLRRPAEYKYKEATRWQREARGTSKWESSMSGRPRPVVQRFNPEFIGLTKGTSSFAWKWWYTQQAFLPQVAPEGYVAPQPCGKRPAAWDEEFTEAILSLTDTEVRQYGLQELTRVIFEESQRDGYELRRLNFEGVPLTELPDAKIIENFVFEEETLRERVIRRVVEGVFRLAPTSDDRAELKTVANILDFVSAHVVAARDPPSYDVPEKVKDILSQFHLQPKLGFQHALPAETRSALEVEWERLHHLDWQFGKAVYEPRSKETKAGNLVWLREELEDKSREAFRANVASGAAKEEHMRKIREAAETAA